MVIFWPYVIDWRQMQPFRSCDSQLMFQLFSIKFWDKNEIWSHINSNRGWIVRGNYRKETFLWVIPRSPLLDKLFIYRTGGHREDMSFAPIDAISRIARGTITCQKPKKISHFGRFLGWHSRGMTHVADIMLETTK